MVELSGKRLIDSEAEMRALGAEFAKGLQSGDLVLLYGQLGAGKTTFVRGVLQGLGYEDPVRSPTFNLIQLFETQPPLLHADLYRLETPKGLGLEDYLESHVCFIEWAERLGDWLDRSAAWEVHFEFEERGRRVTIASPHPMSE